MKNLKFWRTVLVATLVLTVMLSVTGGTIAWFTDEVTSQLNVIEAGNLNVELYVGSDTKGDKVGADTVVFEVPELWEPGAVSYKNVTIANEGNLYLDYRLGINFGGENYVVDANGETTEYSLSDVLKVAMVEDGIVAGASREAVLAAAKAANGKLLSDSYEAGTLSPADAKDAKIPVTKTYGFVIYWEPSAEDNNWNLNNGKKTSDGEANLQIDLGVKVTATQADMEEDAFGDDYDSFADVPGVIGSDVPAVDGVIDDGQAVVFGGDDPMNKEEYVNQVLVVIDEPLAGQGALAVTNVKATVDEAAVVIKPEAEGATIWFIDTELTIPDGAYAVVDETNNPNSYMVILRNTTINGTLVTPSNKGEFLKYFPKITEDWQLMVSNDDYNWTNTDAILTETTVDEFLQDGFVSNSPEAEIIIIDEDANVPGKTAVYVKTMPGNAAGITDVNIAAKNVFVTEVAGYVVFENVNATLDEGGMLFINLAEEQCHVAAKNITINGKVIESWDELLPYMSGKIMNVGFNYPDE